ncbi:hypothetical protein L6452_09748 [Arctium lappa]|uniref:Uncharacterized protein n=1 Tax=Arctium lappa TaxID=4217 RepID=A0ACB9DKV0_ARCLA|nr:hypothetical protein L6452_09748 [Arctium lappa]
MRVLIQESKDRNETSKAVVTVVTSFWASKVVRRRWCRRLWHSREPRLVGRQRGVTPGNSQVSGMFWVGAIVPGDCAIGTIAGGTNAKGVPWAERCQRLCHAMVPWHYRRVCTVGVGTFAIVICDNAHGTIAGHYRPRGLASSLGGCSLGAPPGWYVPRPPPLEKFPLRSDLQVCPAFGVFLVKGIKVLAARLLGKFRCFGQELGDFGT